MRHIDLERIFYIYVDNKELGPDMPEGMTKGILHGIYGREGQALLGHVLLESGAHWSGIPLANMWLTDTPTVKYSLKDLQPWGCMGKELSVSKLPYLEGLRCNPRFLDVEGRHTGIIIDFFDGFSIHPQEHKPLSLIALDNGQLAMLPNNYYILSDPHFTKLIMPSSSTVFYRRGETVYWER
jgi:hypothetical protein